MSITITNSEDMAKRLSGKKSWDEGLTDFERAQLRAYEATQNLAPFASLMEGSNTQQQFPGYGADAPLMNGMADDQGPIYADSTVGGNSVAELVPPEILELATGNTPPPTPGMTYNPGQGGQTNAPQRPSYGAPTQRTQLQMGGRQPQAMGITAGRQNTSVSPVLNQTMTNMNNMSRRKGLIDDDIEGIMGLL
jgi:hypothetical protein